MAGFISGVLLAPLIGFAANDILQLRSGYLWSPVSGDYFIPHGIAYQTFNPDVGATQTFPQLEYDLTEFKRMHANSVRLEFVWNQVETAAGVYDWSKPDFVVGLAEQLGLRLFVLIGFNYAPGWFPAAWKATRDDGAISNVVNYEHPQVRAAYSNFVYEVTSRYRDRGIVAAWILGNEFAYFDLWDAGATKHFLGYDAVSQGSFRGYLQSSYSNNIAALNQIWGSAYGSFAEVVTPQPYPAYRTNTPAYFDLVQWRKLSIGRYVAVAAMAARQADPNHLLSYSMVGAIFSGNDADYTAEDAKTIVACCAAAKAPLDVWSINNYPRAATGSEQRSADFGVAKYRAQSGLPVLVTETGYSSTEVYGEPERQAAAIPSALWEALVSGALGVHLFTWNDRDLYRGDNKPRERGFGIVNQDRTVKDPAYWNVAAAFRTMESISLDRLLPGSKDPTADIQLYWSRHADLVWPRANQENTMIWGALKRLGYQPGLIDDEQFAAGAWTNSRALLLSRCMLMKPADLDRLATNLIPAGVNIHANGDLPGECDAYGHRNPAWAAAMSSLFGIDVSQAYPGVDSGVSGIYYAPLSLQGSGTLGPFSPGYSDGLSTWRIWHGLVASSGTTIVTHTGAYGSQSATPALQIKSMGAAKTAVNTFALGDTYGGTSPASPEHPWDIRSSWLRAIYRDWFGLRPAIELSGTGANYVMTDYRPLSNGSLLVLLINEDTNHASITLAATNLIMGRNIENPTTGGLLATNSTGALALDLEPDQAILLYAYKSQAGVDASLLNSNPNKLWITDAPMQVWPNGSNWNVTIRFDVNDQAVTAGASFERVLSPNLIYARTNAGLVSGKGVVSIPLCIPNANPRDPWYISTPDGGEYVFHAWLEKNGTTIAQCCVPVRMAWGLLPISAPEVVVPGSTCYVTVGWQELPSYLPEEGPVPLDRAPLWELYLASRQYYKIVVQLRSAGQTVATQEFLTNRGTDQHTFGVAVPSNASGPFTWAAFLQTAPGASVDLLDSFENRDTGADQSYSPPFLFGPWVRYVYTDPTAPVDAAFWASGVYSEQASDGLQSAFLVVTNPPAPGAYSGFGMSYDYPESWALPRDLTQWTNYSFVFDFKEANGLPCVLELQVKDGTQPENGQIHLTSAYLPGVAHWQTFSAPLNAFAVPPWVGHFNAEDVKTLVLNIQMLQAGAVYFASVDNVRFIGPRKGTLTAAPLDVWAGFDDRPAGGGPASMAPFVPYIYSESGTAALLDARVIMATGLNGGAAMGLVATNPSTAGAWSGFGLLYPFTNVWSLPSNTNAWTNYVFSFAFREAHSLPCTLELQVNSDSQNRIIYTRTYAPGTDGWDTIRASLKQFVPAAGSVFDRTHIQSLAVNIRMLNKGVAYNGFFDNFYFDAPDQALPSGSTVSSVQFTNTVTPDATRFQIESAFVNSKGQIVLSWPAHSNLLYSVEYAEDGLGEMSLFVPLPVQTNLTVPVDTTMTATDTNVPLSRARFYRVSVQPH